MKTESTIKTNTPGTRVAVPQASASPSLAAELEAELLNLAQEEETLRRRTAERRQLYWEQSIATLAATVDRLAQHGFERAAVAKALGFTLGAKPTATTAPTRKGGPATQEGWHSLFVNAGVRSYLKQHPDLAVALKSQGVRGADLASHLPPEELSSIETSARAKAQTKCPSPGPGEAKGK